MGKGELIMKLEKTWSGSSNPDDFKTNNDLSGLVGVRNIGIDISITNPYRICNGPITRTTLNK